ncbi:VTC domain-containing protein [Pterulicium gracile]|uniref:Vacuolar transporter chaperone complex subunit 4 n=1 Tax=Pterulicium gracile TaxID=1884261 RepID=A0A5C3QM39_9AGAR|nr:VTC domain-containing protein [Pterula gracilis]
MKFGQKINNDLYNEWRPFYLDYTGLKRELKDRTVETAWNSDDEHAFTLLLEGELDKIHDFQKFKTSELSRRIHDAEKEVKRFVAEQRAFDRQSGDPESQTRESGYVDDDSDDDGGEDDSDDDLDTDDDQSMDALEERFQVLEEEVATLVADVHDLALYTKLNITGFMKILKKHDKRTGIPLKATFIQDYLEKRPFYKYNWDALIVKLSKLYDLVRTRGNPVQGDSSAGGSQSAFVRQTTKYWVHQDNLVPLKLAILRHLPVLVFDSKKDFEQKDAAITSIYFDNEELELYLGRLEKTEGAEAVRLRWYGDMEVKTIFVERKTHREDWTGEKSVKARFPIKEHLVNAFLTGEYTMDDEFQQLVKKGKKTQAEVDSMIQLANEVQYAVLVRKLRPVVRTFYNRTAFQLPGDARVRISLDTELTMVREDNWDGKIRAGDNWRRTDFGIDHPFPTVAAEDKEPFKYGVLEVKLQTQFGQEPPKWVTDLVQSHLVEAVPKFSKFIHGCATLLPNRVDLVPFWLPQMDTDILKPDTGYLSILERRSAISSPEAHSGSTSRAGHQSGSASGSASDIDSPQFNYNEPVSEGEDDEEMDRAPAHDEGKRIGLEGQQYQEAVSYREQMLKENRNNDAQTTKRKKGVSFTKDIDFAAGANGDEADDEAAPLVAGAGWRRPSKPRAMSIDPLAPSSEFDKTLMSRLRDTEGKQKKKQQEQGSSFQQNRDDDEDDEREDELDEMARNEGRELSRSWRAPSGKRISVPIRIEPKVYFACERTFLKWINNAIFIGTIATTLLNFVPPDDSRGLISASIFTLASLLSIAYACGVFLYRAQRLRLRRAAGLYYDKWGPTMLCLTIFAALATNIGLRVDEMIKHGS